MPLNRKVLATCAIGAAISLFAGCNKAGGGGGSTSGGSSDIVIGEYGSLTGSEADFGTGTDNGIQLAAEQINAAGGILGRKITIKREDDTGNADQVATIVTRFVNSDKVDGVIGEVASSLSLRAAPICQQAGVPMITPSSTNVKVTQVGNYIFRVCYIDPFQGTSMARFAAKNLHAKTAAILRDVSSAYSVGLADFFIKEFKAQGGRIVTDKSYQKGDDNFRAQLTDIVSAHPDVVMVPGYYSDVSLIAKQARESGLKVPLLGGDGWDSPNLIKNAGTALEGCYFSNHYSEEQGTPAIAKYVKDYTAKYNTGPTALSALGYDAMNIFADAVKRAGSTDHAKVRDALAATKNFVGVTGNITIDPNRNANKPLVVLECKGDKFAYVTTVKP